MCVELEKVCRTSLDKWFEIYFLEETDKTQCDLPKDIKGYQKLFKIGRSFGAECEKIDGTITIEKSNSTTIVLTNRNEYKVIKIVANNNYINTLLDVNSWINFDDVNIVEIEKVQTYGKMIYISHLFYQYNLSQLIYGKNKNLLQLEAIDLIKILLDVSKAIKYFHDRKLIHRLILPSHIFIKKEGDEYYGYLLPSENMKLLENMETNTVGTGYLKYRAPEMFIVRQGKISYSIAVDIWSMGLILCEIFYGKTHVFDKDKCFESARNFSDEIQKTKLSDPEAFEFHSSESSEKLEELVKSCLEANPNERKSAEKLVNCLAEILEIEKEATNRDRGSSSPDTWANHEFDDFNDFGNFIT